MLQRPRDSASGRRELRELLLIFFRWEKASFGIIRITVLEMKGILVVLCYARDLQWLTVNRETHIH